MRTLDTVDLRPRTYPELLRTRAATTPNQTATFHRLATNSWAPTTWSALWDEVRRAASVFRALGLRPGDRLAIRARTCREWQVAEIGALLARAAVVGIDAHAAPEQAAWILKHSRASALVVDDPEALHKLPVELTNPLKFSLSLFDERKGARAGACSWQECVTGATIPTSEPDSNPHSTDAAVVIYTSGTTGTPKGIEYSHEQLITSAWAMLDEFPDFGRGRFVCWLPMSALFQRMMNLLAFATDSVTYFVEDPREIMSRLPEIRPTVFTSVPRFYEKLYDGIQQQVAGRTGLQRRLVERALAVGAQWSGAQRTGAQPTWGLRVRHAIVDRLVLRRMRTVMGGEIRLMISGSSAAPIWLLEFFHSIGLLILEAYGVTEDPVPVAANRPTAYRFGSVGKPFSVNQVRIGENDEVLVRGPATFGGYIGEGRPADRFTADGYYRTGDYGYFDADGFLYLRGRVAEIIKTSSGRRVSPVAVEGIYRQSRYVDHLVVVGNNRPYLVALVTINASAVKEALDSAGAAATPPPEQFRNSAAVIDLVQRDFAALGERVARHERIRAFAILSAPFSIESGELTATLKPRRPQIEERYRDVIEALFSESGVASVYSANGKAGDA
jgi:long-chain acyl-CoA synthetase